MFRGVAQLNLDSKGRLAVPSRFRDALITRASGHLVLTADSDRCLLIYPLPDWEPIEQKLMSLSSFNAQIRELQRRLGAAGPVADHYVEQFAKRLLKSSSGKKGKPN